MKQKPSFKSFMKGNFPKFGEDQYILFVDDRTKKMYKEKNAFNRRLLLEITFCIMPIVIYFIIKILLFEIATIYTYLNMVFIISVLLIIVYFLRYWLVKFEIIQNKNDALDTRLRVYEISFFVFGLIEILVLNNFVLR